MRFFYLALIAIFFAFPCHAADHAPIPDPQAIKNLAAQGDADAEDKVGLMYLQGMDEPKDYVQALKWFEQSAKQGNTDAAYNAGNIYDNGISVGQDYAKAAQWYLKAADGDKGKVEAQAELGAMYSSGRGVPQDYAEAAK